MRLTYIHHSCFVVETELFTLVFDYYKDAASGWLRRRLPQTKGILYVFSSHAHADHFNPEVLRWKTDGRESRYILSRDIADEQRCASTDGFFLAKGETYRDENIYVKAYGSTDQGISFYVEAEGRRIFHAGDLNDWHWKEESTPEEIAEAETFYQTELDDLAREVSALDVVMFPLDPRLGNDFGDGAGLFLKRINTGLFVPMHSQGAYAFVNRFAETAAACGSRYFAIAHEGDNIEV